MTPPLHPCWDFEVLSKFYLAQHRSHVIGYSCVSFTPGMDLKGPLKTHLFKAWFLAEDVLVKG